MLDIYPNVIEKITFEEYEDFLKSRCFPEGRDKIKIILKELNLHLIKRI